MNTEHLSDRAKTSTTLTSKHVWELLNKLSEEELKKYNK